MRLRVLTWNCFGMAQGLDAVTHRRAPAGPRLRDAGLLERCADTDLFCVQELFSREAQEFFDHLQGRAFPSSLRDDNRLHLRSATVRGTGLGIGSRSALQGPRLRTFSGRSTGWDRLARKGALHARLNLDGVEVDVLTSHLQAGYTAAAVEVRALQLLQVRALIDELASPERPFIVCGDFNIDGLIGARGSDEYRRLAAALDGFDDLGSDHDLPTFHPHPEGNVLAHHFEPEGWPQRLDYIFLRPASRGPTLRCSRVERVLDRPLLGTPPHEKLATSWASDHFGLCATFDLG